MFCFNAFAVIRPFDDGIGPKGEAIREFIVQVRGLVDDHGKATFTKSVSPH